MKITFLGTGTSQGIPVIGSKHPVCLSKNHKDKRLRASLLIACAHGNFVIDCGPDFRQQMLRAGCEKLDALWFTHEHSDHIAGLDDIRPFYFKQGNIPIYAHRRVLTALEKRFDYIFETENKYPGAPSVQTHVVENRSFQVNGLTVTPIDGLHGSLQVFGYRFANVAYLTDMKSISIDGLEKLQGVEILVINALRKAPHYAHLNLDEALAYIRKINPKKAYLTHLSFHMGFHESVQKSLPEGVFIAYDGLEIEV